MARKKHQPEVEHADLEERFQISTEIEFNFSDNTFEGLKPFEVKEKKKQHKKTTIENVELRKTTGSLF